MQAVLLVALVSAIELGWACSYALKYRNWRRVRRLAESRNGGPVPLDDRTLLAIQDVGQLNRDESWFNAFLLYHLPVSVPIRLATGRFHVFHRGGWKVFVPTSAGTLALYASLAWWLFGSRG
ncbi:hypothetical protein [Aquisphaera insulae]|uniref:hypothetical protein n=1 Tax=Aquisphaera insulae TaxID=2712864 RepID=UPI0013EA962F|nr:hypothetical protein [Aquisphaera insulae]